MDDAECIGDIPHEQIEKECALELEIVEEAAKQKNFVYENSFMTRKDRLHMIEAQGTSFWVFLRAKIKRRLYKWSGLQAFATWRYNRRWRKLHAIQDRMNRKMNRG